MEFEVTVGQYQVFLHKTKTKPHISYNKKTALHGCICLDSFLRIEQRLKPATKAVWKLILNKIWHVQRDVQLFV